MEAAPASAEQYIKIPNAFFFQVHLSLLQLHNRGAHLDVPRCLKIISLEMFALLVK